MLSASIVVRKRAGKVLMMPDATGEMDEMSVLRPIAVPARVKQPTYSHVVTSFFPAGAGYATQQMTIPARSVVNQKDIPEIIEAVLDVTTYTWNAKRHDDNADHTQRDVIVVSAILGHLS